MSLARARQAAGDFAAAVEICRDVLRVDPDHAEAVHLLGIVLCRAGYPRAALPWLERAVKRGGADGAILYNYGLALRSLGEFQRAARAFRLAVQAASGDPDSWLALGATHLTLAQFEPAHTALKTALDLAPERADISAPYVLAAVGHGLSLQKRGALDAAHAILAAASAAAPDNAQAHVALGNVLRDLGRFESAQACLARALELAPDDAETVANHALAFQHAGALGQAIATYRRAVELAPHSEPIRSNLAQALLLDGQSTEGWREFEHRLIDPVIAERVAGLPGAPWRGEPLAGKTLVLACEQGLGDAIQFARYVPALAARGATVLLSGPARLGALMRTLGGLAAFVAEGQAMPDADFHAPLLSVPHLLGASEIPATVPYLSADPARVALWRERLAPLAGGRRIGIAWQGNPGYAMDYLRSVPPDRLGPLFQLGGAAFVKLQAGEMSETFRDAAMFDPGPELDRDAAFADTAAIMANLDLVVTSDTAIAHLAGALARPAWVMLSSAPDWRWRLMRDDCAWYPTLRLFRQQSPGDWGGVIARIAAQLRDGG